MHLSMYSSVFSPSNVIGPFPNALLISFLAFLWIFTLSANSRRQQLMMTELEW